MERTRSPFTVPSARQRLDVDEVALKCHFLSLLRPQRMFSSISAAGHRMLSPFPEFQAQFNGSSTECVVDLGSDYSMK